MKTFIIFLSIYLFPGILWVLYLVFDKERKLNNPNVGGALLIMFTWPLILIFSYICVKKGFETFDDFKNYIEEEWN